MTQVTEWQNGDRSLRQLRFAAALTAQPACRRGEVWVSIEAVDLDSVRVRLRSQRPSVLAAFKALDGRLVMTRVMLSLAAPGSPLSASISRIRVFSSSRRSAIFR